MLQQFWKSEKRCDRCFYFVFYTLDINGNTGEFVQNSQINNFLPNVSVQINSVTAPLSLEVFCFALTSLTVPRSVPALLEAAEI